MENARAVVCTYNSTANSYKVSKLARHVYGIEHVVARVDDPQEIEKFEQLGVVTMNIALDRAALLGLLVRNPGLYNLMTRTDDNTDVGEVVVRKPSHFGKRIRDLDLPEDLLILALYRENEFLIPNGDTELALGDRLSLLGKYTCIERAEEIFG